MATTVSKTILLAINGAERPLYEKNVATAVVKPGDLLAVTATVTGLASAGAVNQRAFAVENPYAPTESTPAIDQTYAVGDTCRFVYAQPGDLINANIAASQTVLVGSQMISTTTAGQLGITTVDANTLAGALVGIAEEAVTTGGGETARCKVRIV